MRIYLDSAPVIYFVERATEFYDAVDPWMSDAANRLIASDLTRMECRTKPVHEADDRLLENFDAFFDTTERVILASAVVDLATMIKAPYRYDTPDALHIAAAVASNCDIFLTNDRRLSSFPDMTVELIG